MPFNKKGIAFYKVAGQSPLSPKHSLKYGLKNPSPPPGGGEGFFRPYLREHLMVSKKWAPLGLCPKGHWQSFFRPYFPIPPPFLLGGGI